MNNVVRADLCWWRKLIDNFNRSITIRTETYYLSTVSDLSLRGFATYLGNEWIAGTWNDKDCINVVFRLYSCSA